MSRAPARPICPANPRGGGAAGGASRCGRGGGGAGAGPAGAAAAGAARRPGGERRVGRAAGAGAEPGPRRALPRRGERRPVPAASPDLAASSESRVVSVMGLGGDPGVASSRAGSGSPHSAQGSWTPLTAEQSTGTRFIASFPGTSLPPASEFEQPAVDFIFASPHTKVSRVALAFLGRSPDAAPLCAMDWGVPGCAPSPAPARSPHRWDGKSGALLHPLLPDVQRTSAVHRHRWVGNFCLFPRWDAAPGTTCWREAVGLRCRRGSPPCPQLSPSRFAPAGSCSEPRPPRRFFLWKCWWLGAGSAARGLFLQNKVALLRPQLPAARARRLAATGAERSGAQRARSPGQSVPTPDLGEGAWDAGALVSSRGLSWEDEGFLRSSSNFPFPVVVGTCSALPWARSLDAPHIVSRSAPSPWAETAHVTRRKTDLVFYSIPITSPCNSIFPSQLPLLKFPKMWLLGREMILRCLVLSEPADPPLTPWKSSGGTLKNQPENLHTN